MISIPTSRWRVTYYHFMSLNVKRVIAQMVKISMVIRMANMPAITGGVKYL
jgi:hypothetical protein